MGSDDDLLDPSEIEALLNQTGGGGDDSPAEKPAEATPAAPAEVPPSPSGNGGGADLLDASDIEALLQQKAPGGDTNAPAAEVPPAAQAPPANQPATSSAPVMGGAAAEQLINEAEANLAAAISPNFGNNPGGSRDLTGATALPLNDLTQSLGGEVRSELSMLQDVELDLRIELGRTELMIEEVVSLAAGSVVPLDKLAGDPVDILVNGRLIARGEILVLNDNFCVRIAEILTPQNFKNRAG